MTLHLWAAPYCLTRRDCECCGALGALVCREPHAHEGIHFFQCERCGKDKGCWN